MKLKLLVVLNQIYFLKGVEGLEPLTFPLRAEHSTLELHTPNPQRIGGYLYTIVFL